MNTYLRDFTLSEKDCILIDGAESLISNLNIRNKYFNIYHCNIRSVNKNFNETLCHIGSFNGKGVVFDIIVFTETWQIGDPAVFGIPGYSMIYNEGNYNQNDGVIVYIKEDYSNQLQCRIDNLGTVKYVNVYLNKIKIQLSAIYRPHGVNISDFNTDLLGFIEGRNEQDFKHFILGDINIDIMQKNEKTQEYLNNFSINGYISLINNYTRVQNKSKSCIDHIFLKTHKNEELENIKSFRYRSDITDHFPTIACMPLQSNNTTVTATKRQMEKIDYRKLNAVLSNESWEEVYTANSVNEGFELFQNGLRRHIEYSTSKYTVNRKKQKRQPWITDGLMKSVETKQQLYNKHMLYPENPAYDRQYKTYKNRLKKLIEETKKQYFKSRISKESKDSKVLWDTVNLFTSRKKHCNAQIDKIKLNGEEIANREDIANSFNEYFSDVGEKLAKAIPRPIRTTGSKTMVHSIFFNPTDEAEVSNVIEDLKLKKAPGVDGITAETLKAIKKYIIKPLAYLINEIFSVGIFPQCLKNAIIKPLFKKGDKFDMTNYRPISLISSLAKIVERIIKKRLLKFLEKYELISKKQFGFREKTSTDDAIFHLTSNIYRKLEKSKKVLCVFLDLAKAFDTVDHRILIDILNNLGIRGPALKLFKSYLFDRQQMVAIENHHSSYRQVKYGVPQGTVLGPLLFIIYINGLLELELDCGEVLSFADDTVIMYEGDSWDEVKEKAERKLVIIKNWFDSMSLTINFNKTKFITFSSNNRNIPAYRQIRLICATGNILIEGANYLRYLGVDIDKNLKWDIHINNTIKKLRRILYTFRQIKKILDIPQLKVIYHALVGTHIQYGISSWGGTYDKHIKPLEIIQKMFLKTIFGQQLTYSSDQIYKDSKLFDIRQLYTYKILTLQYKNKSTLQGIAHEYNTRHKNMVVTRTIKVSTSHCQRSGWFLAPHIYRQLPNNIKESKSIHNFKKQVKQWIFSKPRECISNLIELITTST